MIFKRVRKAIAEEEVKPPVEPSMSVIDFYPVKEPYTYIAIYLDPNVQSLEYRVIEPMLTKVEKEVLEELKEYLLEEIEVDPAMLREYGKAEEYLKHAIRDVAKRYRLKVSSESSLDKISYYIIRDFLGYGPLDGIIRDPNVEDITCDGVNIPIYVYHRLYEWLPTNVQFKSEDELLKFARKLAYRANQSLTSARPIVEGPLPEGYRVHLTLREVSRRGPTFTIRKYAAVPFTPVDLINLKTIDARIAAYLWMLIDAFGSMLIIGKMASGKTSLLNAVSMFIRPESKIVTVEETPELRLPHENWTPLVARPSFEREIKEITLFDLLKSALRQRPDYIIVGEIRGEEAYTFFQAMAVGHGGLSTFHGESVEASIARLEAPPINIPRTLIPLLKCFVHIDRVKVEEGIVRRVLSIVEVAGLERGTKEITLHTVFKWNQLKDTFEFTGKSHVLEWISKATLTPLQDVHDEFNRRTEIMEVLAETKISRFERVSQIIREYYRNPEGTYAKIVGR